MHKLSKLIFVCIFLCNIIKASPAFSSTDNPIDLLRKDFPNLVNLYKDNLSKQYADYVIALDVSLSMVPYWNEIIRGIEAFIKELPDGDNLSIIIFGDEARILGHPIKISSDNRLAIIQDLNKVRPSDKNTDLADMIDKVLQELNAPGGNKLKYVFMFTDFLDDPKKGSKFFNNRENHWKNFRAHFNNTQSDKIVEAYALQLQSKNAGRDIGKIKNIFNKLSVIEIRGNILSQWFERKKAEIYRDRLRSIILEELINENLSFDSLSFISDEKVYTNIYKNNLTITDNVEVTDIEFKIEGNSYGIYFRGIGDKVIFDNKDGKLILGELEITDKPFFEKGYNIKGWLKFKYLKKLKFPEEIKKLELEFLNNFNDTLIVNNIITKFDNKVSFGFIPSYITYTLIAIIILYLICVMWTLFRPLYINGRITLIIPGKPPRTKEIIKAKRVSLGLEGNYGFNIDNIDWKVSFKIKRNCPCMLWKKAGIYFYVDSGQVTATVKNPADLKPVILHKGEYMRVTRGVSIKIDKFDIIFN